MQSKLFGTSVKKITSIMLFLLLIVASNQNIRADEIARVYSDINTYTEKTVDIPIKISNNRGLMGYKFTVKAHNLVISDVVQGEAFSDGMFNYKIGDKKETVEIIWTNNAEIKTNGELFAIKADVKDNKVSCELELIYSKSDTINGDYNEVSLACDLITITPESDNSQPTTSNTSYEDQAQEELILGYIDGMESDDVKKVIVQSLIASGVSIDSSKSYSVDELKTNIDTLTDEQKSKFINSFNQEIANQNPNLSPVPENNGVSIIKEILECTDEYTVKSITQPTEPEYDEDTSSISTSDESMSTKDEAGSGWIIPALVIAVCVVAAILLIIILRKRRMKNEV